MMNIINTHTAHIATIFCLQKYFYHLHAATEKLTSNFWQL